MKNKKLFIILITLFFYIIFSQKTFALTLSHPEEQHMTVSEDGIFFSGKIGKYENVYINNVLMHPEKSGAFSYSFPLNEGENIFAVQVKDLFLKTETIKYTIKRVSPQHEQNHNKFVEQTPQYYITMKDNVVLRSTPIDEGMNRLGYLPTDTKVFVDGTTNEFSRVYLSPNNYGWVMTKHIKSITDSEKNNNYTPISILSTEQTKTNSDTTYTVTLSDNCPYSAISDGEKLTITLYNLDNDDEMFSKEFNLGNFPRYSVIMQNGVLYVMLKNTPITNKNYSNRNVKIIIDAGHGGKDTGAVGCLGDKEKILNLDIALKLKKILEEHNFRVIMTRETDKFVSLDDRVKLAKDNNALIFVSIHLNSVPISSNPNLNQGTIVYYFNPQSKDLAQSLSKSISKELGTINGGASQASLAVARPTEYIGVLAELVYLVNPKDVVIYKNKKFTSNAALSLYKGITDYIHTEIEK